ncbi:type II restriction endonuclease [Rothia aeria]|jgi:type-2 restriction enzyme llaDCHI|uniref:type II restriction endonuclease n=1 Tax=Rothia aeria TaxID=172042 RepID=UPI0025507F32|nr:type II restriction endonuclease [Rothia aeria]MDK7352983.1 type II restriction endonuclease [Rothia aeria]MDK7677530.1 type II restriction endonuclease [Rothia aeria]
MKYNEYMGSAPEEKLKYFLSTLSITNRTPEYYVNWEKVNGGVKKHALALNTLNYLIGLNNLYEEAIQLFTQQPNLLEAVPVLFASRDVHLDVMEVDEDESIFFYNLDFKNVDTTNIQKYVDFMQKSGLLDFLKHSANRSLVDYAYGVEVGLDSNGRKNRSGKVMEDLLEGQLRAVADFYGYQTMTQATAHRMRQEWQVEVPVDKSERKFDGALFDSHKRRLFLFETNYYGGGGSKLKSVAGEFKSLYNHVIQNSEGIEFVWVTDGQGWKTTAKPLSEAFAVIPNIFNINQLHHGYLREFTR